ncbi:hypothetical protein HMPREF0322_00572 [Desulfitobacterium hafniense DP7]|uniref:Uncharacterized protein n=2 Tax=Desulfitobacterium hafniense TaxID=49338 RepID=A0A0W1JG08_DESHA|nr:hypothetical protein HMPREF0322_00572 [Desulfitobacterium hafniense DP7]KTE90826.1 hypothetical protein AT727_23505 [Desulfitobacterium hafniense]
MQKSFLPPLFYNILNFLYIKLAMQFPCHPFPPLISSAQPFIAADRKPAFKKIVIFFYRL